MLQVLAAGGAFMEACSRDARDELIAWFCDRWGV